MNKAVACVIPARLEATRFPKKLLKNINGKPLIVCTVEKAIEAQCFSSIICLTDSLEIKNVLEDLACSTYLTKEASNGTDRISKNLNQINEELIINLQGDEPFFPKDNLLSLKKNLLENPSWVHVCGWKFQSNSILTNPNRVKLAYDSRSMVKDFFRLTHNKPEGNLEYALQQGVYGYSKDFLRSYSKSPISEREQNESHEMLRILPLSNIKLTLVNEHSQSIDVPEDLEQIKSRVSIQ